MKMWHYKIICNGTNYSLYISKDELNWNFIYMTSSIETITDLIKIISKD